jgi:hypothetical protein
MAEGDYINVKYILLIKTTASKPIISSVSRKELRKYITNV